MGALPRYQEIAGELRAAIYRGEYQPGDNLPQRVDLMNRYGVSKETVSKVYRVLEAEGLVQATRKSGTRVRRHPERLQLTRERTAYRDEIGYFFDLSAQHWRALGPVEINRAPAPGEIARLLDISPGTEVVIRDRVMGDPDTGRVFQLTASYLPADLVDELPVLESVDTGPGGIYDRIEEAGHGPLTWYERLSARAATAREVKLLALAPGVPVQRIVRTSTDPRGKVCEINAISLSAELHEIGYPIERHPSARPST
ncbi:GntR family transcriptional regulator [Amycolatopsis sp. cg5]|uniref:GntR family transcriptional regulator n=1 Tax=Amycolatopsis sp. cg5 TaxID=3238802 RepID=UPI003523DB1B